MSDNLLLNKIWNPLKKEFEPLSNDLLKKYISNFMNKKDELNIMSGGTDPASTVTTNNYFDIGNAKKYVGKTNKRKELREEIKKMIDAMVGDVEEFREFLKFMRDFHYTVSIKITDKRNPTNIAVCLARLIRENDYHTKIGLPSLMLEYKKVFENKNAGGNMRVKVGDVEYVLDSTVNPLSKEDDILSLYKGDVEKLKNFGNNNGDVEHGLASNTVRILMRELYSIQKAININDTEAKQTIRNLQKYLLWREISSLNMSRSNHNVPIDVYFKILEIIAKTPKGTRSLAKNNDLTNYVNEAYVLEKNDGKYFAKYKLKSSTLANGKSDSAIKKLKEEGDFITNVYTVFPKWLYKSKQPRHGFKLVHKLNTPHTLTTTQLIAITNTILRYYHLFKIIKSSYDNLKERLLSLKEKDVRDDIFKSVKIVKMFIIDGVHTNIQNSGKSDLIEQLKTHGEVDRRSDIDPSIYIGLFFYKMCELQKLEEESIKSIYKNMTNDVQNYINETSKYYLIQDGYLRVNKGIRNKPEYQQSSDQNLKDFYTLLAMILYRKSRWALHKHFKTRALTGKKTEVTKQLEKLDIFNSQFSDSYFLQLYKVGKDLYDNAKQLFEHSKKGVNLNSLTPPEETAAQMIQGGGESVDVKTYSTQTMKDRMNALIKLRKEKRMKYFQERRDEAQKRRMKKQEQENIDQSPDSVFGVSQAWGKDQVLAEATTTTTDITSQRFDEIYENLLNMQLEQQKINQSICDVVIDFLICNAECEEVEEPLPSSPRKRKPTHNTELQTEALQTEALQTKRARNPELPTIKSENGFPNSFPDLSLSDFSSSEL